MHLIHPVVFYNTAPCYKITKELNEYEFNRTLVEDHLNFNKTNPFMISEIIPALKEVLVHNCFTFQEVIDNTNEAI